MRVGEDKGFSLVELMSVVLIIGILVAVAIPTIQAATARASQRTCFSNQRIVEGAVQQWRADGGISSDIAGVVNSTHPLVHTHIISSPPRCPAAPAPTVIDNRVGARSTPTAHRGMHDPTRPASLVLVTPLDVRVTELPAASRARGVDWGRG